MNSAASPNAEAIAAAQRRYSGLNLWFWLFVAAIPLGVVLPCALSMLAYRIWGDEVSAPVALSALLWPIVGVAGALLVRGARQRARRSLDLAKLADALQLRFTYNPPAEKFVFLKSVSFMADPHTQTGLNLLEGQAGRWPLVALDYEYSYLYGSVTETGAQTIAVMTGFERLPALGIFPIGMMGKLENLLLGKWDSIPFPHEPQFNGQFAVVGDNPAAVVPRLTRPLVDLLLADRLLSVIVENGRLLVFRRLTYVRAADYRQFLGQAHRVAELLAAGG